MSFEFKYSESGTEPVPARISERQLAITATSGLYADPEDPVLFASSFQQTSRELNLTQSLIDHGDIDEAVFVLSAPRLNHLVAEVGEGFAKKLNPPMPGKARFVALTLERLVEAQVAIGMVGHAQAFHRRYLDLWQVDGQLELEAAEATPARKTKGTAAASLPAP